MLTNTPFIRGVRELATHDCAMSPIHERCRLRLPRSGGGGNLARFLHACGLSRDGTARPLPEARSEGPLAPHLEDGGESFNFKFNRCESQGIWPLWLSGP